MNTKHQSACALSGVLFMILFGVGWALIAQFIPPLAPSLAPEDVVEFYQANTWSIRCGLILCSFSITFYYPWISAISMQLNRIEGNRPVYSSTQLIAGATGAFIVYFPMMIWLVATFRLDRNPEIIQTLNDFGWLMFTSTIAPFVAQNLAIALAIFSDKSSVPVFPRWLGFYNLVVTTLFLPTVVIIYFKAGPFAWNGVVGFWIPVIDFFIWMIIMTFFVMKAVKSERAAA